MKIFNDYFLNLIFNFRFSIEELKNKHDKSDHNISVQDLHLSDFPREKKMQTYYFHKEIVGGGCRAF